MRENIENHIQQIMSFKGVNHNNFKYAIFNLAGILLLLLGVMAIFLTLLLLPVVVAGYIYSNIFNNIFVTFLVGVSCFQILFALVYLFINRYNGGLWIIVSYYTRFMGFDDVSDHCSPSRYEIRESQYDTIKYLLKHYPQLTPKIQERLSLNDNKINRLDFSYMKLEELKIDTQTHLARESLIRHLQSG